MIDTHCHLVPGVDDGPSDQREAVELARALTADGVTDAICTPHYARMSPFRHETAAKRLAALSVALRAAGTPLELTLAARSIPPSRSRRRWRSSGGAALQESSPL